MRENSHTFVFKTLKKKKSKQCDFLLWVFFFNPKHRFTFSCWLAERKWSESTVSVEKLVKRFLVSEETSSEGKSWCHC